MIEAYFDGLCEPNPGGVATYGFLIKRDGKTVDEGHGLAGTPKTSQATNNVAEYTGLIRALEWLVAHKIKDPVTVRGDSDLIIRQVKGEYKVKSGLLAPLHAKVKALEEQLPDVRKLLLEGLDLRVQRGEQARFDLILALHLADDQVAVSPDGDRVLDLVGDQPFQRPDQAGVFGHVVGRLGRLGRPRQPVAFVDRLAVPLDEKPVGGDAAGIRLAQSVEIRFDHELESPLLRPRDMILADRGTIMTRQTPSLLGFLAVGVLLLALPSYGAWTQERKAELPQDEQKLFEYAQSQMNTGAWKEAERGFKAVLDRFPDGKNAEQACVQIGNLHHWYTGQYATSREWYLKACEKFPKSPNYWTYRIQAAQTWQNQNLKDKAIEELRQIAKEAPDAQIRTSAIQQAWNADGKYFYMYVNQSFTAGQEPVVFVQLAKVDRIVFRAEHIPFEAILQHLGTSGTANLHDAIAKVGKDGRRELKEWKIG